MKNLFRIARTLVCLFLFICGCQVKTLKDLETGFLHPPAKARPWVYWFWLNGNITRQGITADLEAMKRVGIGGVLIMEVDQGTPAGPVSFAGKEWRELFAFVCQEAHRLGLEVNMNNDAGWCGSGGPWITPDLAMQKVVFSETNLEDAQQVDVVLPQPLATADYYRDIAVLDAKLSRQLDTLLAHPRLERERINRLKSQLRDFIATTEEGAAFARATGFTGVVDADDATLRELDPYTAPTRKAMGYGN